MIIKVTDLLNSLLYIKIFNIPFIIIWVIATGIFAQFGSNSLTLDYSSMGYRRYST